MILSLLAAAVQAASPIDAAETRFRACAETARADPQAGVEAANAWLVESGALHARQCLGLAYVGLERWAPAATVYEQAAEAAGPGDPRAADFLVQSGNAWLAGGEPTRAIEAFDRALATTHLTDELRGEVHLDRARALVALGNAEGARADLDRGLALVPADPFGWYLSAALAQRQGDLARARADIGRARERAPDDPDVLLLAGTIAGLSGNMDEAERLYRRVAALAPNSPAGRTARESLPVEDGEPEEPPQSR